MAIGSKSNISAVLRKTINIGTAWGGGVESVDYPLAAFKKSDDDTGESNKGDDKKIFYKLLLDPVFNGDGEEIVITTDDNLVVDIGVMSIVKVDDLFKGKRRTLWKIEAQK